MNRGGSESSGCPWFWAAALEEAKFGGRGPPWGAARRVDSRIKGGALANTTLAVVATDAVLTKAQARRLAVMAQDGLARAIYPVHTPLDGDVVFAIATSMKQLPEPLASLAELGTLAANVLARAVAVQFMRRRRNVSGRAPAGSSDCITEKSPARRDGQQMAARPSSLGDTGRSRAQRSPLAVPIASHK